MARMRDDTGMAPLVGRREALAGLEAAIARLREGRGGCAVLEGPAGVGKTRLLMAALAHAEGTGWSVAAGRATEFDRGMPPATLLNVLGSPPTAPPVLGRSDAANLTSILNGPAGRFRLVDRIGELVQNHARTRPLVIAIDDAHWADELTALALGVLVPALRTSPVLWLFTRRPIPPHSPGQDVLDSLAGEGALRYPVEPLTDAESAELCAHVLNAEPDASVLALVRRTGGSPFLIEELFASLLADGRVSVTDGRAHVTGDDLPAAVPAALERRMRDLPADARLLLEAGSILGRPFSLHEAARLGDSSAARLVAPAREVVRAGLLVDDGAELGFRHDLIRETVYDGMPGAARRALHREAADILQAEGASAVEVSCHVARSARVGDLRAVITLRDAARQVATSAPSTAADLLLHALDLTPDGLPDRPLLIDEAVPPLALAGRLDEARSVVAACDDPVQAARLRTKLAEFTELDGLAEAGGRATEAASTSPERSSRPASGWDSLTDSELRVVRVVAEGLTNRETARRLFLSPHTVDSHLRHAFAKLGISGRVELTRHVVTREGGTREGGIRDNAPTAHEPVRPNRQGAARGPARGQALTPPSTTTSWPTT